MLKCSFFFINTSHLGIYLLALIAVQLLASASLGLIMLIEISSVPLLGDETMVSSCDPTASLRSLRLLRWHAVQTMKEITAVSPL